jgi:hypothetical protein
LRKHTLVQNQMNALRNTIVETLVIGEFDTHKSALDFLEKREYKFDNLLQAYVRGNTLQYPVVIKPPTATSLFDIRSFV